MGTPLTAEDLWPLVLKMHHDEQVRLARLALRAAARGPSSDADSYVAAPPLPGEFDTDEEALVWDADGWDEPDAPR